MAVTAVSSFHSWLCSRQRAVLMRMLLVAHDPACHALAFEDFDKNRMYSRQHYDKGLALCCRDRCILKHKSRDQVDAEVQSLRMDAAGMPGLLARFSAAPNLAVEMFAKVHCCANQSGNCMRCLILSMDLRGATVSRPVALRPLVHRP